MKEIQSRVACFVAEHGLEHDARTHLIDLVSEIGELSKQVLLASNYGRRSLGVETDFSEEWGDACYSLLALAIALDVDAEAAVEAALHKYEERLRERGQPGSN